MDPFYKKIKRKSFGQKKNVKRWSVDVRRGTVAAAMVAHGRVGCSAAYLPSTLIPPSFQVCTQVTPPVLNPPAGYSVVAPSVTSIVLHPNGPHLPPSSRQAGAVTGQGSGLTPGTYWVTNKCLLSGSCPESRHGCQCRRH